jgi:hypothetical protein
MARGVKGTGTKKAPAKARLNAVPPPQPPKVDASAQDPSDRKPLGSVDVDSLSGDALRRYAQRAGVLPRDVVGLTEDRLRQNTKLTIANHFELLTED